MQKNFFEKSVKLAHFFAQQKIASGDVVVDATCGNGHDTLFLAERVGKQGKVYAFDVQPQAIEKTRERLTENDCMGQVELICASHERVQEFVHEKVKVVLFNLGFLPKGNKSLTTLHETTIRAIENSLDLLETSGIILIVFYPGHEAGALEREKVSAFAKDLPQTLYNVVYCDLINQANNPPTLLGIEKR